MPDNKSIPPARDKPLFTPGPLTTSLSVKTAMLRDLGSRDAQFIESVRRVRRQLLDLAGVSVEQGYEAVLMQGAGTFGIEAVLSSTIPPAGKLLVVINGAYGRRIKQIAEVHKIATTVMECAENEVPSPEEVDRRLTQDADITHVAVVHCETTSGVMNPIESIGQVVRRHGRVYFVDSMSAFGAVPFDFEACCIDFLVSSANKCIEGVPGFSFAICRRETLSATAGYARTLSLDLLAQWRGLETNGQFRFTPPTHTILAFDRALEELRQEGGVAARGRRYRANYECLIAGTRALGLEEYVPRPHQGTIITSFRFPEHERFTFDEFYNRLNDKGFVIYPGKVTGADCFRIGTVGRIFESDVRSLLAAIGETLAEMGVLVDGAVSTN